MGSKRLGILFLVVAFSLTIAVVHAAAASYVVIKDKNGVCRILEAVEKTPKTIAGPFKTREEAEKAKERECPKAGEPTKKATDLMDKAKEKAKDKVDKTKVELKQKADKAKEEAKEKADKAKAELKEKADKAKEKAKEKVN
jgi:hypothetical protein